MKITKEKASATLKLIEELIVQRHPEMKGLRISQMLSKLLPENSFILSEPAMDLELLKSDIDISFLLEPEYVLDELTYEEPVFTFEDELHICDCSCHTGKG